MPNASRIWVNPAKLGPLANLPSSLEPVGAIIRGERGRIFKVTRKGLRRIPLKAQLARERRIAKEVWRLLELFDSRKPLQVLLGKALMVALGAIVVVVAIWALAFWPFFL